MRYLDASVLVPLVHLEASSMLMKRFVGDASNLHVSDFAIGEVASAIGRLVRSDLMTDALGQQTLVRFELWAESRASAVTVAPFDTRLATQYLHRFELGLRLPDAIHLAVCRRLGMTIVTFDRRLLTASAALGIPAEAPEA